MPKIFRQGYVHYLLKRGAVKNFLKVPFSRFCSCPLSHTPSPPLALRGPGCTLDPGATPPSTKVEAPPRAALVAATRSTPEIRCDYPSGWRLRALFLPVTTVFPDLLSIRPLGGDPASGNTYSIPEKATKCRKYLTSKPIESCKKATKSHIYA